MEVNTIEVDDLFLSIFIVARYGETCNNDNDCKRPFTCFKKRSSSSGSCRCPLKYDFVNNQCST